MSGLHDGLVALQQAARRPHRRRDMRNITCGISGLFLFSVAVPADDNLAVVERFAAAFNDHDVEAMLELTIEEVRWMSVAGESVSVETSGRDPLRASMSAYFADVPSARAVLRSAAASGPFVQTVEEAMWTSGGEQKHQCSAAVYELEHGSIINVWYFPAHECT